MKKRTTVLMAMVMIFMFIGCAGMPQMFEPAKPYCTAEEQKDSLIYKYLNPGDANFTLKLGVAATLNKHPERAADIKKALLSLKAAVESGISYVAFAEQIEGDFGPLTAVILGEMLTKFKSIDIPLSVCDKRLSSGAVDNMLKIVERVKRE